MDYHLENMHNLHVLNFSTSNGNKSKTYDDNNDNCKECDIFTRHNSFDKYKGSIKARSTSDNLSETQLPTRRAKLRTKALRRIVKKSLLNLSNHKRSISLHEFKKKISLNNLDLSDQTRQRARSSILQTFLGHKLSKNVDVSDKDKNCQVLFKFKRNISSTQMRKRNISKEVQRLDFLYGSKSSANLFRFQPNNFYKPNSCYQLFRRHSKRAIQNCKCNNRSSHQRFHSKCDKKHETEHINSRTQGTYSHTMPFHFNLVDLPYSIQPCEPNLITRKSCVHKVDTIDLCPCIHEQVSVTPTCFAIKKESGDSEIISRCVLIPKFGIQNKSDKCIQKNHSTFKRKRQGCLKRRQSKHSLLTFDHSKNPVSLAKSALKYILFGLAVIAWSPCVITIGLYWLITYPLTPQYILNATGDEGKNRYKNCDSCYKWGHDFLHSIFKTCVPLARRVCCSHNALLHLITKLKPPSSVRLKPCRPREFSKRRIRERQQKKYPNPKNKYTLYYTRRRGWKMKPICKRGKNINKNYQCQPVEDEKPLKASKENHNKHFHNEKEDKDKRDQECGCHTNDIQNDKVKTEQKDKDCECHTDEKKIDVSQLSSKLRSGRKHSIGKLIQGTKLQLKSRISQQILQKNSLIQKSVEEKLLNKLPDEKKHRPSSPVRELFIPPKKLTTTIRAPKKEIFKSSIKPTKYVSFRGNIPKYSDTHYPGNAKLLSPRLNRHEPSFIRPYCTGQRLDKIRKINKSCPYAYKNKIQKSTKAPTVRMSKEGLREVNFKKYESKGQKLSSRQKLSCWCQTVKQNFKNVINDVDGQAWKYDICDDMLIYTLRRRPWFWIYNYCPSFYPYFLMFYKFYENVVNAMMFIVSACIWIPLLCWCYFCYTLFCRCIC